MTRLARSQAEPGEEPCPLCGGDALAVWPLYRRWACGGCGTEGSLRSDGRVFQAWLSAGAMTPTQIGYFPHLQREARRQRIEASIRAGGHDPADVAKLYVACRAVADALREPLSL